jgi:hypothetical protein
LEPIATVRESALCCDVLAHGGAWIAPEQLAGVRRKPGPAPSVPLPVSVLKHSDDQTVAGMAAVLQAISSGGLGSTHFTEWGVLAAPRFLGRVAMVSLLQRFAAEGAWGVTPHLIPHRSLHSLSGTVSQALKIHGPNLGIGGGPGALAEILWTATAMLHGDRLPGVWIVLTGWTPEPVGEAGEPLPAEARCTALAMALTAARSGWHGPRIRLIPTSRLRTDEATSPSDGLTIESLQAALNVPDARATTVVWQLGVGVRLELEHADRSHALAGPHGWQLGTGRVHVGSSGAGAENSL